MMKNPIEESKNLRWKLFFLTVDFSLKIQMKKSKNGVLKQQQKQLTC
jgi:hypothetical protein